MTGDREYTCSACGGRVSMLKGQRRLTLDTIRQHHNHTCPQRARIKETS